MRRIAHYHTISVDLRKEWHRLMVRTRFTDEHLKSLFMEGLEKTYEWYKDYGISNNSSNYNV